MNKEKIRVRKKWESQFVLFTSPPVHPSLPEDADNMNNFATLLGKLFKVWQGRLEVINYSNVSSEPCRLRRGRPL